MARTLSNQIFTGDQSLSPARAGLVPEAGPATQEVSAQDANFALIYKDGILDYDAHDAYLRALGYEYLALPCSCGGSDDDGHLPSCGWGRAVQDFQAYHNAGGGNSNGLHVTQGSAPESGRHPQSSPTLDGNEERNGCVAQMDMPLNTMAVAADESRASAALFDMSIVRFAQIELETANKALANWGHRMGPLHRGNQGAVCHGLFHGDRLIGVTTVSSLIAARVGGGLKMLTRENSCELSRLCAERSGLCRVVIRLWREFVFPTLGYEYAISYQDADLHNGNTYRFDGWHRAAFAQSGRDTRSGRPGRNKWVWVWPPINVSSFPPSLCTLAGGECSRTEGRSDDGQSGLSCTAEGTASRGIADIDRADKGVALAAALHPASAKCQQSDALFAGGSQNSDSENQASPALLTLSSPQGESGAEQRGDVSALEFESDLSASEEIPLIERTVKVRIRASGRVLEMNRFDYNLNACCKSKKHVQLSDTSWIRFDLLERVDECETITSTPVESGAGEDHDGHTPAMESSVTDPAPEITNFETSVSDVSEHFPSPEHLKICQPCADEIWRAND